MQLGGGGMTTLQQQEFLRKMQIFALKKVGCNVKVRMSYDITEDRYDVWLWPFEYGITKMRNYKNCDSLSEVREFVIHYCEDLSSWQFEQLHGIDGPASERMKARFYHD